MLYHTVAKSALPVVSEHFVVVFEPDVLLHTFELVGHLELLVPRRDVPGRGLLVVGAVSPGWEPCEERRLLRQLGVPGTLRLELVAHLPRAEPCVGSVPGHRSS